MMEHDDRPPISEWLTGIENANEFLLEQLAEETKHVPGPFTYLFCIMIYGAIFWFAFENAAATLGLTLIPVLILSYDADRRNADIRTRRLIEHQNGMIRSLFIQQQRIHADVTDCVRQLYKEQE